MRFHDRAQLKDGSATTRPASDSLREIAAAPALGPRPLDVEPPFLCDRCGTAMFRMHSVWRCPSCGFKTDCCGW